MPLAAGEERAAGPGKGPSLPSLHIWRIQRHTIRRADPTHDRRRRLTPDTRCAGTQPDAPPHTQNDGNPLPTPQTLIQSDSPPDP